MDCSMGTRPFKGGEGVAGVGAGRWALIGFVGLAGILDTSIAIPTIAAYAQYLGASEALAGLITGLYSMVALPASLVAGVVVDRVGRRRALSAGLVWDSLSVAGYAASSTPEQLALFRALHAIGGSLVYPAYISRIAGYGERGGRGLYLGYALAAVGLSVGIGVSLGGLAAAALGFERVYLAVSALLMAAAAASLALEEEPLPRRPGVRDIVSGLRAAAGPVALGLSIIFTGYLALGLITGGLAPALLKEGIAETERDASAKTGLIIGGAVAASVATMPILGASCDRYGLKRPISLALAASLAGVASYPITSLEAYSLIAAAAGGLGLGGILLASTLLLTTAPRESRGSAIALQQVFNILGIAVGAPLGGILAGAYGLSPLILGITLLLLASLIQINLYHTPKSTR